MIVRKVITPEPYAVGVRYSGILSKTPTEEAVEAYETAI
jgi:hypothetical protein